MLHSSVPLYTDIVSKTLTEINVLLAHFTEQGFSAVSGYVKNTLNVVTTLYLAFFGYGLIMGKTHMKMDRVMGIVLRIAFVYVVVNSWGWVSEYCVNAVNDVVSGVGGAILHALPIHIPGVGGLDGAMQTTLIEFTKVGSVLYNTGGWTNIGGWIDGWVIWGFGYLVVALGMFEIILARIMLAILFIFTPIMVVLTYFKPFQHIFDRWLGAIVGFALLQLFVSAALSLALALANGWVAMHATETALDIGNYGTLPILIIGFICMGIILKASQYAQNIGGNMSSSSAGAMMGGLVGGFMGSAMNGLQFGAKGAGKGLSLAKAGVTYGKRGIEAATQGAISAVGKMRTLLRRGE